MIHESINKDHDVQSPSSGAILTPSGIPGSFMGWMNVGVVLRSVHVQADAGLSKGRDHGVPLVSTTV